MTIIIGNLTKFKGIGKSKACVLLAVIELSKRINKEVDTVVTEYKPHDKRSDAYQSEADLEKEMLQKIKYYLLKTGKPCSFQ